MMSARADTCGHVEITKPKPVGAASAMTAVCFQGGAAPAGVRLHRPADHGAAGAAGVSGSSGRAASAPQRVSRNGKGPGQEETRCVKLPGTHNVKCSPDRLGRLVLKNHHAD